MRSHYIHPLKCLWKEHSANNKGHYSKHTLTLSTETVKPRQASLKLLKQHYDFLHLTQR